MIIGRGDVNPTRLEFLTIGGMGSGHPANLIKEPRQFALMAADMEHYEQRRRQISREGSDKRAQRLDPTGRSPDYNDSLLVLHFQ